MRKELKISKPNNVKYTRKGKELTMKPKAEKPKKEKQLQTTAVEDNSVLIETLQSELARLSEINEGIQDELDIKYYEATAEEKVRALQTIDELREENRKLKIDLVAVKKSRDQFQNENASLKKQIESLNRKLKS
jgi:FtsZ-binding cell division protein ZapB